MVNWSAARGKKSAARGLFDSIDIGVRKSQCAQCRKAERVEEHAGVKRCWSVVGSGFDMDETC